MFTTWVPAPSVRCLMLSPWSCVKSFHLPPFMSLIWYHVVTCACCMAGPSKSHSSQYVLWRGLSHSPSDFAVGFLHFFPTGVQNIAISVSVCLSGCSDNWKTTCWNFTKFSIRINSCRGLVVLVQQCNMLYTSGFVDHIMFLHNGANGAESKMTLYYAEFASWRHQGEVWRLRLPCLCVR